MKVKERMANLPRRGPPPKQAVSARGGARQKHAAVGKPDHSAPPNVAVQQTSVLTGRSLGPDVSVNSTMDTDKEDELNERVHKFYSSRLIFAGTVNFFFPTWKVVPGAYSDRFLKNSEPWNTPKEWFLSRKRPKEGERVG